MFNHTYEAISMKQKAVKLDHKKRCWESVDYQYMTDESEGGEDSVAQHPLLW